MPIVVIADTTQGLLVVTHMCSGPLKLPIASTAEAQRAPS